MMHKWRVAKASILAIVVALMGLGGASTAQAQPLLSLFFNASYYWELESTDRGNDWLAWEQLPHYNGCSDEDMTFTGPIAAATDQPHSLTLAAKNTAGFLVMQEYDRYSHRWMGWCDTYFGWSWDPFPGGTRIDNRYYTWIDGSEPVLSSWGPGRLDLWIVARRDDGALALLHGWTDNGIAFQHVEELGTGLFSGNPAVVSWGPGRIDVFIRAADHDLAHKWFDGGHWSRGWEDMGAAVTANPTVASEGPGQLDLFVVGGDQALWQRTFNPWGWSNWIRIGGVLQPGTSPSAASFGPGFVDVFLYDLNGISHEFSFTNGVFTLNHPGGIAGNWATHVQAIYWVP
jgi:hypothetical protein